MLLSTSSIRKTSQRGMSLISLMVGIALSSVSMLAATHMHSSHHAAIASLQTSIVHNRLLATALNNIQLKIQSAGYGITDADQTNVVTQFTPGNATNPATRSILWRYIDNGTTQCRAIIESGFIIDGVETRELKFFRATTCLVSSPLADLTWDTEIGTLGQWRARNELATYINANSTLFNFTLNTVDCAVPGLIPQTQHLSATISAPDTAALNGHSISSNNIDVCLINIYPI